MSKIEKTDDELIQLIKDRYSNLHPLLVHRSIERAKNPAELFDILDEFKHNYPVIWDEKQRKWTHIRDIFLHRRLKKK